MEDHLVLVVPTLHPWAHQQVTLDDLRAQPVLMREVGSGSRRILEQALVVAGLKPKELRISMELDSNEALLNAVEAGLGVAFVSRWAMRHQLALGTLGIARIPLLKLSRNFSLAYPAGPEPTGNLAAFRGFLLAHARDLAPPRRQKPSRPT